ncbi:hypothetical protein FS837_012964 [Tulasnella sp. UAMH 9824]|nr:hypothetical protein FS837_012964 [Tulasnella sp. UAMH 9824]
MVFTRGKKINFDLDSSEVGFEDEEEIERPEKPPTKRRKPKKSKSGEGHSAFTPSSSSVKRKGKAALIRNQLITRRSGRGGKLRDLMDVPVDIFTEICSYLDPHDLRRLAVTSKRLWDILMTKEVRQIWRAALASVPDLPECPTDLNEPQYVCLLYSSEWYTIGCTSRGTKVDWFHRVRFCAACQQAKSKRLGIRMTSWLASEKGLELGLKEGTLFKIQYYLSSTPVMGSNSHRHACYIEALKKVGKEYESLPQEEVAEYFSGLKETRDYRVETGRAMMEWKRDELASRAEEIAAEKQARFESIKVKLVEMGWDEQDFPTDNKEFRDLVFKDQKLTPKIWQNIKPKLEPLLEAGRNERLEIERWEARAKRGEVIRKSYHQLAQETMGPPFHNCRVDSILTRIEEVFALPSIKPLLENDTETITEAQWIEVVPDVRHIAAKWWRDILKQFVDCLEHSVTAPTNEVTEGDEEA